MINRPYTPPLPDSRIDEDDLHVQARRWRGFGRMFMLDPDRVFDALKTCKHRPPKTLRGFASTFAGELGEKL